MYEMCKLQRHNLCYFTAAMKIYAVDLPLISADIKEIVRSKFLAPPAPLEIAKMCKVLLYCSVVMLL